MLCPTCRQELAFILNSMFIPLTNVYAVSQSYVNVQLPSHFPTFPEYTYNSTILRRWAGNAKAISNVHPPGNMFQFRQEREAWGFAMWWHSWGEILCYFRSDHDVNLICELYSHSCERGKLMWYQGKTP